jgi:hypothetical protein
MSGLDRLFAARDTVSQQEGIKQEWAKEKTMAKRDEINALPGAGLQNIMGAGGTFAGLDSASDSAGGIFEDLFGTKDSRTAKRDWRKEQKSA